MSDTLKIYGVTYTGVTSLNANDTNHANKQYIRPQGTKSITQNGTGIDVSSYASVDVAVPGSSDFIVTVSYNSTTQRYEPDCTFAEISAAYAAQKTIVVAAIKRTGISVVSADGTYWYDGPGDEWLDYNVFEEYQENNISYTREQFYVFNPSGLNINSTKTYVRPSGTYTVDSSGTKDVTNYASASVPSGTVTAPSSISGTSATVSTGTNTLTLSKTVSVTPNVTSAGWISSGTAGNASVSLQASVTTKGATTYNTSATDQTIASGTYLTGTQTIRGVTTTNLTADNIKSGVTVQVGDSADSDRVLSVLGTYTGGGGGGGIGTLLNTTSIGTVSTTSTQAASLNVSLSVSGVNNYDLLIVESSVNTATNGRHTATVGLIFLTASSAIGTKNGATIATAKLNSKLSSTGVTTTSVSTTAYGIYPNSCTVSNGTATIPMYRRYNSTSTGTMNGTYTARVYGVNLYDLIGG